MPWTAGGRGLSNADDWITVFCRSELQFSIKAEDTNSWEGNLFIFFFVLTTSMGSNVFWGTGGHWVTLVLTYLYVLTFAVGVLLSLGNRPQSTKLYGWLSFLWIMFGG